MSAAYGPHEICKKTVPLEIFCYVVLHTCTTHTHTQITFGHDITKARTMHSCMFKMNKPSDRSKVESMRAHIYDDYKLQWIIDDMPVTWCFPVVNREEPYCTTHIPVGCYVHQNGQRHGACYLEVSCACLSSLQHCNLVTVFDPTDYCLVPIPPKV